MRTGGKRRVDEKGRITIPEGIRESLDIDAGEEVEVVLEESRIVIRPRISREDFVESIDGCVNDDSRKPDAEPPDPDYSNREWTSDLPN